MVLSDEATTVEEEAADCLNSGIGSDVTDTYISALRLGLIEEGPDSKVIRLRGRANGEQVQVTIGDIRRCRDVFIDHRSQQLDDLNGGGNYVLGGTAGISASVIVGLINGPRAGRAREQLRLESRSL